MAAEAVVQMRRWLADEIENRRAFLTTLQELESDPDQVKDKESALNLYEEAARAAEKSQAELEAFFQSHADNQRAAAMAKVWGGFLAG